MLTDCPIPILQLLKWVRGVTLFVLLALLFPFSISAQIASPTPSPLTITFEGIYPIMRELRAPLQRALESNLALLPSTQLTVSAYRDQDNWAKVTLVPTALVDAGWANVDQLSNQIVEVLMTRIEGTGWIAIVVGSPFYEGVHERIPLTFYDTLTPLPAITGAYRFPWRSGETWWAVQGWHGGNALDFQPALNARSTILAAQAGRLREICSDGYQSLIEIQHGDGRSTFYLHVTLALGVRRALLDHNVERGQYLGELFRLDQFVTPCGRGYARHLHFAVSDPNLLIDGIALEDIASVASCCQNPPTYTSSNVRVDRQSGS